MFIGVIMIIDAFSYDNDALYLIDFTLLSIVNRLQLLSFICVFKKAVLVRLRIQVT